MLARGDSQAIQSLPAASPPPFPAWARAGQRARNGSRSRLSCRAALSRLDAIVRENPPWGGVWRQRLALSAAAASVRRAGRTEDEAALRDAFHLSRPGGDPGPAGKFLLASRELGQRPDPAVAVLVCRRRRGSRGSSRRSAGRGRRGGRGLRRLRPAGAVRRRADVRPGAARPDLGRRAPVAWGRGGEGELLAAWLADAVLAQRLNWPFALPLLAAALFPGAGRAPGGMENPADGGETTRVVFAYAKAAAGAVDRAGDLARRAEKLREAAPKLRAKGAGAALRALLDEDCLAASSEIGGQISERGARRLFDRLVALGAIRELTGRATFRLYGL